jgi:hypothetical protein
LAALSIRDERRIELSRLRGLGNDLLVDIAASEPLRSARPTASPPAPIECEVQIARRAISPPERLRGLTSPPRRTSANDGDEGRGEVRWYRLSMRRPWPGSSATVARWLAATTRVGPAPSPDGPS